MADLAPRDPLDEALIAHRAPAPLADLSFHRWALNGGARHAEDEAGRHVQVLLVPMGPRPTPLAHSVATGAGLVSNGQLGVDVIRLGAGQGFMPHTHPGDHILIVVAGIGTITIGGKVYRSTAGTAYMVDGAVPHAVGAITDHVILAVGAPHKAVDDPERMTPVEYTAVAAEYGDLCCTICPMNGDRARFALYPMMLHDMDCPHCPCPLCMSTGDPAEDEQLRRKLRGDRFAAGIGAR